MSIVSGSSRKSARSVATTPDESMLLDEGAPSAIAKYRSPSQMGSSSFSVARGANEEDRAAADRKEQIDTTETAPERYGSTPAASIRTSIAGSPQFKQIFIPEISSFNASPTPTEGDRSRNSSYASTRSALFSGPFPASRRMPRAEQDAMLAEDAVRALYPEFRKDVSKGESLKITHKEDHALTQPNVTRPESKSGQKSPMSDIASSLVSYILPIALTIWILFFAFETFKLKGQLQSANHALEGLQRDTNFHTEYVIAELSRWEVDAEAWVEQLVGMGDMEKDDYDVLNQPRLALEKHFRNLDTAKQYYGDVNDNRIEFPTLDMGNSGEPQTLGQVAELLDKEGEILRQIERTYQHEKRRSWYHSANR